MTVTLVGAGCGGPGLLPASAVRSIEQARHIVYDRLIHPDILQLAPEGCEFYPAGKRESSHTLSQEGINELLIRLGRSGERVVRLKGGDPFIFGRGGEEAEALEASGIPWSAVPGITSAAGGGVSCGLPLTHRDAASSVTLMTGHRRSDADCCDDESFWSAAAESSGTVAFYMGVSAFEGIAEKLVSLGRAPLTRVSVISWGGWGRASRTDCTLSEVALLARAGAFKSPSIIYVGETAGISLNPQRGALSGLQVIVCRPYPDCWETGRALEAMGADCYGLPLLKLSPLEPDDAEDARRAVESADWLVLTSPRGPRELRRIAPDIRRIRGRVAALGSGTAKALEESGIVPDYTADGSSEGLADMLSGLVSAGESVVFARNERGSNAAVSAARDRGADVRVIPTYRMLPNQVPGLDVMKEQWSECGTDAVVFGSAAFAEAYAREFGSAPESAELIAWGSVCAEAIERVLHRKPIKLAQPNLECLAETLAGVSKRKDKPATTKMPNPGTLEAFDEIEKGGGFRCETTDELFAELGI